MLKKVQQYSQAPLMYIANQPTGAVSGKMQCEYRHKEKGKQKEAKVVSEQINEELEVKGHHEETKGDLPIEEEELPSEGEKYKPYRIYKKEMTSPDFDEFSIEEKVEYLASLPPYIKNIVLEFRVNNRLYIGKIYSYIWEEKTLMMLNTNSLKILSFDIKEIQYLKIISL